MLKPNSAAPPLPLMGPDLSETFSENNEPQGDQRVGGFVEVPTILRENGADTDDVFRRAGIAVFRDMEARAKLSDLGRLIGECAAATKLEHFGLLAGARWRLEHLGVLGELMRCAPNLGEALRAGSAYHWQNASGAAAFITEKDGLIDFGYGVYLSKIPNTDYLYDLALAFEITLVRELIGWEWRPLSVSLPRLEPAAPLPYRRFFGAPVAFNANFPALRFPVETLARKLPGANPERWRDLKRHMAEVGREDLTRRVRRAVRVMLTLGEVSGDEVAARLGMHRRTLNRHLEDAGTSFRAELDHVRFAAAQQMLATTTLPLADIAPALGYAEASTFVRAFGRWSGMSPMSWRQLNSTRRPKQGPLVAVQERPIP